MRDQQDDATGDRAGGQEWDAGGYDDDFAYVHEYGADVVDLLDPQPGERILDLGCGTGHLTSEIDDRVGEAGDVLGVDSSPEMIAEARETYPELDFAVADATRLATDGEFDAVFSNAALHWIDDQESVAERLYDALAPGGRFVAELGGRGNVGLILGALGIELTTRGHGAGLAGSDPFYFPTVGQHANLLERHLFEVRYATLFDRPTDLEGGPDGLRNWLSMFGGDLLGRVDDEEREDLLTAVEDRLRKSLYDPDEEVWTADYRRLRFVAVRPA